ncbi:MAG: 4-hydroxyphenylacetate 3-monooxygenase, oxygenase component, partial [Actinobacteria bacterium]|nr:4-hydroxyphenylacetate 3-monooxygenase, oxygenase component [Actinomycetota bacterium]
MGIRTGQEYLDKLNSMTPHVVYNGEIITKNIADHPAFSGVARTYARLFDMQHDPQYQDQLTYITEKGDRAHTSFMVPKTREDLERRRAGMSLWAQDSNGFLGRSGDYMNSSLTALSTAKDFFAKADPKFGERIEKYYEWCRDNDILATHTLIPPQVNRAVKGTEQGGGQLAARVIEEREDGIIVSGARMLATIAPIADEMLVFPSTVLRGDPADAPYSYAFAVPNDAPGLRYISRVSYDQTGNLFDEPLAARYEEMDCVVIFDNVFIPNDRVFLLGHPELCNAWYAETGAAALMTHQVVTRTIAKAEFFLGLASEIAESIGIEGFQHIEVDLAELIVDVEIIKALMTTSEAKAELNEAGMMVPYWPALNAARNWYPKISQRFPQIIRKFAASGLMALPNEADIHNPEIVGDIDMYLQSATQTGPERTRLFKLAHDA